MTVANNEDEQQEQPNESNERPSTYTHVVKLEDGERDGLRVLIGKRW
jgi:hypothetical protein